MIRDDFSVKLIALRKKAGMTQKELGEQIGLTNRAVSKWENSLSIPSTENLIRLSNIFNVPLDYFCESNKKAVENERPKGMKSMVELYKIGRGPSSSHTIGPEKACKIFMKKYPQADAFKVVLYGSLAKTGKGHGTDAVIRKTLFPVYTTIEFDYSDGDFYHPNTMDIVAFKEQKEIGRARVFSVGGGEILFENEKMHDTPELYSLTSFSEIAKYCKENRIRLCEFPDKFENDSFNEHMVTIWETMKKSVQNGLEDEGILPGGLNVHKKAKQLLEHEHIDESPETRENRLVCAYAFAVSEQNASGETIVTAPTCGAAGVVPAVLYYQQQKNGFSDAQIIRALKTAGIVGNLIKANASISGAECGCQAEIGSACAMAAAALGELFGLSIDKIEYAAEISIEHHLGLTCDPICGLVQIPCIERNAVAAMRAINAVNIASFLSGTRKISLDNIIKVMKETGRDLSNRYKETSEAGLAKIVIE